MRKILFDQYYKHQAKRKQGIRSWVYFPKEITPYEDCIDGTFVTGPGDEIPVYRHYRYGLKPGWTFYRSLENLHYLKVLGKLSFDEEEKLKYFIGERTLSCSIEEIDNYARDIFLSHMPFFEKDIFEKKGTFIPLMGMSELKNSVESYKKRHIQLLSKVEQIYSGFNPSKQKRVLEIGFISGGHSLYAFEELGFECHGVDNDYGGSFDSSLKVEKTKSILNSQACFCSGDISKRTSYPDNFFDVVYSASVVEHIMDLPGAWKEIERILRPGGVMIHQYGHYFCEEGGHSLGILDAPWAHVRMGKEDIKRYLEEFRPYEKEIAWKWFQNALNFKDLSYVQKTVFESHLELKLWEDSTLSSKRLSLMSKDVFKQCFKNYPALTLNDLLAQNTLFVAAKKASL